MPLSIDAVKDRADWLRWRPATVATLRKSLALDPWPDRTPLNARVTNALERRYYVFEKIVFESRPNFFVTANIFRRKDTHRPRPRPSCACRRRSPKANAR